MKRPPLLSTTMASPKEWLWAMWTVKFFACFIVPIKWPVHPTFTGVNTERQRRLLHLFKGIASPKPSTLIHFRGETMAVCYTWSWVHFMDCLKYFEENSYPSWLQCLMVNSNAQDFYHSPCYFYDLRFIRLTSCNTAIQIPELGLQIDNTAQKGHAAWKCGLLQKLA